MLPSGFVRLARSGSVATAFRSAAVAKVVHQPVSRAAVFSALNVQKRTYSSNIDSTEDEFPELPADVQIAEKVNNILYNTPVIKDDIERRIVSALVENEPGVLSRVSGLLASRGFNIDSLVVSATDVKELSRMTIVLRGAEKSIDQARKQLEDLIHVWAVIDYSDTKTVERELCMVKVNTKPKDKSLDPVHAHQQRQAVIELTKLFEGKVCDIGADHLIVELSSWSRRIDGFITLLKPFGIIEACRSGVMAMARTRIGGPYEQLKEKKIELDPTLLPPS
eukprot:Colp12_sorted_trinity150504_noHs@28589